MDRAFVSFGKLILLGIVTIFAISHQSWADSLAFDFSSLNYFDKVNSTGLWNNVDSRVQGPITVTPIAPTYTLDFGDGRDGAFTNGPTQTGITVSGTTITFNTNLKSEFQFSSFSLSAGYTIQASGSSNLIIRVTGSTNISGTINLDGTRGTGNNAMPGNTGDGTTFLTSIGQGGAGGISAASGGNGGSGDGATAPTAGSSAGGDSVGGGVGVNNFAFAQRGGGGGCIGLGPDAGNNATGGQQGGATQANAGACATIRTTLGNSLELAFLGGSGGGGGGAGGNGAVYSLYGGAGGGGGGKVKIVSLDTVTLGAAASVTVKGGDGGNYHYDAGVGCAAGGGAGSGGTIWIQTGKTVTGTGQIDFRGGSGGLSAGACANTANGGNGSRGIFRQDQTSGAAYGTILPAGQALALTAGAPSSGTYTVFSKPFILGSGYSSLATVTPTWDTASAGCGAAGSATLYFQGSDDGVNFGSDVLSSGISTLANFSYLRFKVVFNYAGGVAPCLTGLTLTSSLMDLNNLKIKGGLFCGTTSDSEPKDGGGDIALLLLAALLGRRFFRTKVTA